MADKKEPQSFLHEFQLEGKGSGKIALENWEDSMDGVNKILTPEAIEAYKKTDWDNLPRLNMATFCQDCNQIVPPELKEFRRGKIRAVCGKCGSKKIASGREEALRKFYHIEEKEEKEKK